MTMPSNSKGKPEAGTNAPDDASMASFKYPVDRSIGLLMRLALHGLRREFGEALAEFDIPYSAWYFLRILWENDGLSQKDLTRRAGVLQPNAVAAIRSMQSQGLVRVEREAEDKRRMRVWLTPKAKELEHLMLPKMRAGIEDVACKGIADPNAV
jgi:DNA-binding MarR family transcriptional regulator